MESQANVLNQGITNIDLFVFQYGLYSDATEITTAAGPPAQCRPPVLTFLSDTCVLISWEVR